MKLKIVFLLLFTLFNKPAISGANKNSCDLLDGYYFGMSRDNANSKYNENTHNTLLCGVDKYFPDRMCTGSYISGVRANVEFVFDEKNRLVLLSGSFPSSSYRAIKQAIFNRLGKPQTGGQCDSPELSPSGSCESFSWDKKFSLAYLGELGMSQEAMALRGGDFLIGPPSQGGMDSKVFLNCLSQSK